MCEVHIALHGQILRTLVMALHIAGVIFVLLIHCINGTEGPVKLKIYVLRSYSDIN